MIIYLFFLSFLEFSFFLKLNFFFVESLIEIKWEQIVFSLRVILITLIVFFFRLIYIGEDFSKNRFFSLTFIFALRILIFIHSKRLIFLILGWEGLGIFSYLLIIYYIKNNSLISGILTLLINRLGDIFFITCLRVWIINIKSSFSFVSFSLPLNNRDYFPYFLIILCLLIITMISKSPQYPLNSWLLAAMSAPTPISSLVHSSTLVTAGCFFFYKLIILFFFFEIKIFFLNLILLTILFSRISGLVIYDIKKIIALSTLSQIRLVFLIFIVRLTSLGFLHLIYHAFFKSSLFIISGLIIINRLSSQDIRSQQIFFNKTLTEIIWIYVNFSLTATFFSLRFFTKEKLLHYFFFFDLWYKILFFFRCFLTLTYRWKLFYSIKIFKDMNLSLLIKWEIIYIPLILLIFSLLIFKFVDLNFFTWDLYISNRRFLLREEIIIFVILLFTFISNLNKTLINKLFIIKRLFFSIEVRIINLSIIFFFFYLKKKGDKIWSDLFLLSTNSILSEIYLFNSKVLLNYEFALILFFSFRLLINLI